MYTDSSSSAQQIDCRVVSKAAVNRWEIASILGYDDLGTKVRILKISKNSEKKANFSRILRVGY